jgi:hypothetical protein
MLLHLFLNSSPPAPPSPYPQPATTFPNNFLTRILARLSDASSFKSGFNMKGVSVHKLLTATLKLIEICID